MALRNMIYVLIKQIISVKKSFVIKFPGEETCPLLDCYLEIEQILRLAKDKEYNFITSIKKEDRALSFFSLDYPSFQIAQLHQLFKQVALLNRHYNKV